MGAIESKTEIRSCRMFETLAFKLELGKPEAVMSHTVRCNRAPLAPSTTKSRRVNSDAGDKSYEVNIAGKTLGQEARLLVLCLSLLQLLMTLCHDSTLKASSNSTTISQQLIESMFNILYQPSIVGILTITI